MINVEIIADSVFPTGQRVTTFELEYPRLIHSELMTHRVFSRNASSSRAIPIEKMIEQATDNTVIPMWTKNQAGMQGECVTDMETIHTANDILLAMLNAVTDGVRQLSEIGIHKQDANRYLEPFQHIKVVLTATDFDNFFKLRFHKDAQPAIQELAKAMLAKLSTSTAMFKNAGEWHLPYADGIEDLSVAKKVSASCCAQVSYRKNDASIEKAEMVYERLVGGEPLHASPFEHQCTLAAENAPQRGNLRGMKQLREEIEDNILRGVVNQ